MQQLTIWRACISDVKAMQTVYVVDCVWKIDAILFTDNVIM